MWIKRTMFIATLASLFLVHPDSARAQQIQAAIEGIVTDESGGALPGVTVEIVSPALIEGQRTAVTDGEGNYRHLRLPIGTYKATFSLPGFSTVEQTSVVLNSGFTATINISLKISSLNETIQVSGQSPVVDVKSTTSQMVLTSEAVNTIPTARSIFDMSKVVLGVSGGTPDVGGSNSVASTATQIHGSIGNDRAYFSDGMRIGVYFGGGDAPRYYGGVGGQEEINYQFSAMQAESPVGGININMVSKDGGNRVSGTMFASLGNDALQGSNLDDELRARGVRATSGIKKVYDVDTAVGGPLIRNKAWLFGSVRSWAVNQLFANQFFPDGTQMFNFERDAERLAKVTWQINNSNKVFVKFDSDGQYRPYRYDSATFYTPDAAAFNHLRYSQFLMSRWTGSLGMNWLFEASAGYMRSSAARDFRPETLPGAVARLEISSNTLSGAPHPTTVKYDRPQRFQYNISATRLLNRLGMHEIKAGTQNSLGDYRDIYDNGDHGEMVLRFNNDVPNSAILYNLPVDSYPLMREYAYFAQDSWRVAKRLTINAGLRYDSFYVSLAEQSAGAGRWVPARSFAAVPDIVAWKNVVPRFGISYDVTGTGKTVVKLSASKYMGVEGANVSQVVNPMFVSSNTCAWTDTNNDRLATGDELSRCSGFSGGITTTVDPNLRRPYNREYSAGLQHELMSNVGLSVMFYRRENRDLRSVQNVAVPTSGYIPVTVNNPLTNAPLTVYNQDPATVGRQQNVLTNSPLLDVNYNGVEFSLTRRFSQGASLVGGYHYGKTLGSIYSSSTQASIDLNDPNNFIFANGAVGNDRPHQLKLSGHFMLPGNLMLSGVFSAMTGGPRARQLVVDRTLVPGLTRANQTVRLEANNVERYDSYRLLDLRLGRTWSLGGLRVEPFLDAYNIFNANTILGDITTIGASLGRVSTTINPRLVRLGAKVNF